MKPMCKICKLEVSKKVIELDNLSFLNEDEGQDYIPEGYFIVDDGIADITLKGSNIIKDLTNSKYHQMTEIKLMFWLQWFRWNKSVLLK